MNVQLEYKYDVAISFLQEDEDIARKFNDLLSEHLTTFVYFDHQKELSGTDGEITFNRVFGYESRIVVILYRATWGTTPWTRIEETAIHNRAYKKGYDFLTMIPLDEPPSVPEWLPKTRIWVGLKRVGLSVAAAVIEARVQESGGTPHEESPLEQASRISRQKADEDRRLALLNSEGGVTKANTELGALFDEIEKVAAEIRNGKVGEEIKFACKRVDPRTLNLQSWGYHIYISWYYTYNNTLDESLLMIRILKQAPFAQLRNEKPATLATDEFDFDARLPDQFGWTHRREKRFFTSKQLAAHCVKMLLSRLQKEQPWKKP